jgi:propionate CoA-transferase
MIILSDECKRLHIREKRRWGKVVRKKPRFSPAQKEAKQMAQIMTREQAAALIQDGDTVVITGSGGGVMEAYHTLEGIEERFLNTGHPANLTLVHASGIGDKNRAGVTRFAHKGMVRRVIGGHWGWSPEMQAMADFSCFFYYLFKTSCICIIF